MRKRSFAVALLLVFAALLVACPRAGRSAGTAGANESASVNAQASPVLASVTLPKLAAAPKGASAVWLTTADGWHIAAWYWAPKRDKAPGVILLHQRGAEKSSWGHLPDKLVAEDYAVLAIDLRGHGESVNPQGQPVHLADLHQADYQAMLYDVAAAREYIGKQQGVNEERAAIIGASIGADLAIMYASTDYRVRTAVCLSPGLDYFGLKPADDLADYGKRALYLIAAKGDDYAYSSCEQLAAQALADPVSFRKFEGKAHGTALLAAETGLADTIVSGWLLNHIPPER